MNDQHPTPDIADAHTEPDSQSRKGMRGRISRAISRGASWGDRNTNGISIALASAPGVAEEAQRQGAPDQEGAAEGSRAQEDHAPVPAAERDTDATSPIAEMIPPAEEFVPNGPVLDRAPLHIANPGSVPLKPRRYRKRVGETRSKIKSSRYTPSDIPVLEQKAKEWNLGVCGFIADASMSVAYGNASAVNPHDRATRSVVEALALMIRAVNRIGTNLNQVARTCNSGLTADHADAVLDEVEQLITDVRAYIAQQLQEQPK
ncbi:plasmid mobilization relaxosome protein MobC [Streptomyces sp. NPDC059373]